MSGMKYGISEASRPAPSPVKLIYVWHHPTLRLPACSSIQGGKGDSWSPSVLCAACTKTLARNSCPQLGSAALNTSIHLVWHDRRPRGGPIAGWVAGRAAGGGGRVGWRQVGWTQAQ